MYVCIYVYMNNMHVSIHYLAVDDEASHNTGYKFILLINS